MKRTLARFSAGLALVLAAAPLTAIAVAPSKAGAAPPPNQVCRKVTGNATFTPGLVNAPRDNTVKAKGKMAKCTGKKAGPKTGGSGVLTATIKVKQGSCAKLASGNQTIKGNAKAVWKNKKVSKFALTLKTGTGATATTAKITGKVTAGLFKGRPVTGAVKFTVKGAPNCVTVPVKGASFVNSKPFIIK
jgi:hypothetical protein